MKPRINLHDHETLLIEGQPRPVLVGYLFISKALFYTILMTIGLTISLLNLYNPNYLQVPFGVYEHWIVGHFELILIFFIVLAILGFIWAISAVNRHWYFLTNQRCIIYSGFWGINKKIIPYNRLADVDMNQNPLRGLFGITAVYFDVQGASLSKSSRNSNLIDGLSQDLAEKMTDLISKHISKA